MGNKNIKPSRKLIQVTTFLIVNKSYNDFLVDLFDTELLIEIAN